MKTPILVAVTAALVIAVGTSASDLQSTTGGVTAANMQSPLQIKQYLSGPTWLYSQNRNSYRNLAYQDHIKIFNKFTAVRFVNTAPQPIQQVTFELAAYSDIYRPVVGANGQPVVKQLVATGPFAPGAEQTLVNANVVWSLPPGNGLGCVLLNGMQIVYVDGSSTAVSADKIEQYLPQRFSNHCGVPPRSWVSASHYWVGPSPYIAGVYPAKWMVMHEHELLYRQPYVPPSDTQPLCAVGSLVEESCETAANTPNLKGVH